MTIIGSGSTMDTHDIYHARRHIKLKKSPLEAISNYSFQAFTYLAFKQIEPQTTFLPNWHFNLLCEYMLAAMKGDITRLIINIPPRYMKSTICSVAAPAWLLKENPANKVIVTSFSQELAVSHHINTRVVMNSEWYKREFPHVQFAPDQNTTKKFRTTQEGHRIGTSVGVNIVGQGGNFIVIDDPHNPAEMRSPAARLKAQIYFEQSLYLRLNDKKKGVIVLVMQRMHEDDLTGYLMRKGGWECVKIPGIETEAKTYSFGGVEYHRKAGELLHPAREGEKEMADNKRAMGSFAFAGQYQQEPAPEGGGVFKLKWFGRYGVQPQNHTLVVQSWDTGIKTGDSHDYSVCTTWKVANNKYYLVDVFRDRLEYPDLKRQSINLFQKFNPNVVLIEDKASGQALLQDLKRETTMPVIAMMPDGDKLVRASRHSAKVEAGLVEIPSYSAWLPDFENEVSLFDNATHDDQVDSMTQFLEYVSNRTVAATPSIRVL